VLSFETTGRPTALLGKIVFGVPAWWCLQSRPFFYWDNEQFEWCLLFFFVPLTGALISCGWINKVMIVENESNGIFDAISYQHYGKNVLTTWSPSNTSTDSTLSSSFDLYVLTALFLTGTVSNSCVVGSHDDSISDCRVVCWWCTVHYCLGSLQREDYIYIFLERLRKHCLGDAVKTLAFPRCY
jgi:hypothetical protein